MKGVIVLNRSFLRVIAAALIVTIMSLSFVGCSQDKEGNKVEIGYISGNYQMIVDSVDKINCDYLLIYRSSASYAEIDAFVDFVEKLAASSSATFQICPDTLNVTDANQKIILLGNTMYNESANSKTIMERIRTNNYYDYLLHGYENTLSVTWMSKFGREEAFNYIINTLLNNGFEKVFDPDYSYMYLSDRTDTPVVTIDDINIIQYSVVTSSSPSYIEQSSAEKLVSAIESATGVKIPLVTDAAEESKYEILVGDTNRGETYVTQFFAAKRYAVAQYSTKLILRGGQIESTAKAVKLFTEMVQQASITAEPLHVKANYCDTGSISTYGGDTFDGYELVFSDDFKAEKLDTEKWTTESGAIVTHGDAGLLMHFKPSSIKMTGDDMRIRTECVEDGYTSGHITSEDSFSFKYGYAEVRARFRATEGVWVKLILTDQNDGKESISQIDVFNSIASEDTIFASAGTLKANEYYSNYLKFNEPSYEAYRSGSFNNGRLLSDDNYHTYGVEWTPDYIRFFIDGVPYGTVELGAKKFDSLDTEMYLDFLIGVNLTDQVAIDEVAAWPLDVNVDWVKVYQREGGTFTDRTAIEEPVDEGNDKNTAKK